MLLLHAITLASYPEKKHRKYWIMFQMLVVSNILKLFYFNLCVFFNLLRQNIKLHS